MKKWWSILLANMALVAIPSSAIAETPLSSNEDFGPKWDEPAEYQGFVAQNMDSWIKGFDRVEIVLFKYKEDEARRLVEDGSLHKGVIREYTKRLSNEEVSLLSKIVTGKHPSRGGGFCGFRPHHGFIFYGKDDKVLGHLEICFLCSDYLSRPWEGLSSNWDLNGLRTLVTSLGLPILKDDEDWDKFFASNQKKQKSNKPALDNP